jgi:ATP-binding cassette, subfamily C, bacterial
MSQQGTGAVGPVRHFARFAGWNGFWLLVLMLLAAMTEGIGLLLLVPLLSFVGLGAGAGQVGTVVATVTDALGTIGVRPDLEPLLAFFVLVIIARQAIVYMGSLSAARLRADYVAAIRKEFFAAMGATSWRHLSGAALGRMSQILMTDCWRIGQAAINLVRMLTGAILLAANVVVAILLAPLLAIVLLGSISVLTLFFGSRLRVVRGLGAKVTEINNDVLRTVDDHVNNLRVAKMAGVLDRIREDFESSMDELSRQMTAFAKASEAARVMLQVIAATSVAVGVLVSVRMFDASGPVLLMLVFIAARFIPGLTSLNQQAHAFAYDLPAFQHAYGVLEQCRAHRDTAETVSGNLSMERSIGLRDVAILSGVDPSIRLLDDVTVDIRLSEFVVLSGASGAGKSTLADVLSGLVQPDEGVLTVDGKPVAPAALGAWRRSVGYVPQAAVLLQDTVERNLTWVLAQGASRDDVRSALACVEMLDVLDAQPGGVGTVVDRFEGGLSGGERQRLAIARELLRKPRLLILDEATAALDSQTESRVLANIRRSFPDLAILLITHRPTAVALADRVIQLNGGRVAPVLEGVANTW